MRVLSFFMVIIVMFPGCRSVKTGSLSSESSMEVLLSADSSFVSSSATALALHDSIYIERTIYQVMHDTIGLPVAVPHEVIRYVRTHQKDSVSIRRDTIAVRDTIYITHHEAATERTTRLSQGGQFPASLLILLLIFIVIVYKTRNG